MNIDLADLKKKAIAAGIDEWERESSDIKSGEDPYEVLTTSKGEIIADTLNADIRCIAYGDDSGPSKWDEGGRVYFSFIAAANPAGVRAAFHADKRSIRITGTSQRKVQVWYLEWISKQMQTR